jgi:hypothetical protein
MARVQGKVLGHLSAGMNARVEGRDGGAECTDLHSLAHHMQGNAAQFAERLDVLRAGNVHAGRKGCVYVRWTFSAVLADGRCYV